MTGIELVSTVEGGCRKCNADTTGLQGLGFWNSLLNTGKRTGEKLLDTGIEAGKSAINNELDKAGDTLKETVGASTGNGKNNYGHCSNNAQCSTAMCASGQCIAPTTLLMMSGGVPLATLLAQPGLKPAESGPNWLLIGGAATAAVVGALIVRKLKSRGM